MASRTLFALVSLVAVGLLLPAAGVQSMLRAHKDKSESQSHRQAFMRRKVNQLHEVLRRRMPQLRRAIWDELGLAPRQLLTEDLADAARELLAREADYLAAEDNFAAAMLRDYAQSSLVPALFFEPFAESEPATVFVPESSAFRQDLQQNPADFMSVETVESSLQRNAKGQLVGTVRRCRKNRCVTTEEVQPEVEQEVDGGLELEEEPEPEVLYVDSEQVAPSEEEEEEEEEKEEEEEEGEEEMLDREALAEELREEAEQEAEEWDADREEVASGIQETEDTPSMSPFEDSQDIGDDMASAADTVGTAMRVAARGIGKELRSVMGDSGLPPLSDIFDNLMTSSFSKDPASDVSSSNGTPQGKNIISSSGEGLGKGLKEGFGKVFKDLLGNINSGNLPPMMDAFGSAATEDSGKSMPPLSFDVAKGTAADGNEGKVVLEISGNAAKIGKAVRDGVGKAVAGLSRIGNAIGSAFGDAESLTSWQMMENGNLVCHVRRCRQGNCVTTNEDCHELAKDAEMPFTSSDDQF